jgi:hypothetical protein
LSLPILGKWPSAFARRLKRAGGNAAACPSETMFDGSGAYGQLKSEFMFMQQNFGGAVISDQ